MVTAQEFGAQIHVSPKLLNDEAAKDRAFAVQRMLVNSAAQLLVRTGGKAMTFGVEVDDADPSLRGAAEIYAYGEHIPDLTLLAIVAKQEVRLEAVMSAVTAVNNVSWWRFLWLKLRGKALVEVL